MSHFWSGTKSASVCVLEYTDRVQSPGDGGSPQVQSGHEALPGDTHLPGRDKVLRWCQTQLYKLPSSGDSN